MLQFVADQSVLTQATEVPGLGEVRGVEGARYPMVLTRVLAHDSAAASAKRHNDPTGTIRVPRTQLVEVFLPRLAVTGDPIPAGLARKIRARYPGVVVRCIPGNIYDFQGTRDTSPPYGWPTSLYIVAENTQRYMDTSRTNAA
ncbi:hypothetical protein BLJ79_12275 [Arthrobacter sp. UCD-GKA]|nr:hypothetical protein BLJ79_12275 [Arthrobacter sp. UCD-GKA]